ncbi:hypothetical protein IGJ83_001169 [Enterococcus pernyi]
MNKKAKIKRIAALTCSEKWQENEETVAEVQRIAKTIWPKEKSGRKRPGRKIAIWHDDRILVTGTAEQLAEITGLSKNIIWSRAKHMDIDSKGRQFKYMEEEK